MGILTVHLAGAGLPKWVCQTCGETIPTNTLHVHAENPLKGLEVLEEFRTLTVKERKKAELRRQGEFVAYLIAQAK